MLDHKCWETSETVAYLDKQSGRACRPGSPIQWTWTRGIMLGAWINGLQIAGTHEM